MKSTSYGIIAVGMILFFAYSATAYSYSYEGMDASEIERQVYRQINQERKARGIEPLEYNPDLSNEAQNHSDTMADEKRLFHTNSLLSTFRGNGVKCNYAAENVAYAYSLGRSEAQIADRLVDMWMNSPGHRRNILNDRPDQTGIGVSITGPYVLATQNFCS